MKLKLKPCVTDEDFILQSITNYYGDFEKIRNGDYVLTHSIYEDYYNIRIRICGRKYPTYNNWYVKKHWFITVKE